MKDTQTGFMWAARDNGADINWQDAKRYCENYRGGGYSDWRMPTQDELAGLYDKNKTGYTQDCIGDYSVYMTRLIHLSCCCSWASETRGSEAAWFCFRFGKRSWRPRPDSYYLRALPVRAGN